MQIKLSELERYIETHPEINRGCIVDTNVIFAASYPLDSFNEWGEEVFRTFHRLQIPVYTNQNVRSEFIDLNRRVMIPEGLVDLYEENADILDSAVVAKLKSLKTRKRKAEEEGRTYKMSDSQINDIAKMLGDFVAPTGKDSWTLFCRDFLLSTFWKCGIEL